MRSLLFSTTVLATLSGPALAQAFNDQNAPVGADPTAAVRPVNDIGTKQSLPRGSHVGNADGGIVHSPISPNLPTPQASDEASPADYLRNARDALRHGHTGAAQEALERAETRMLDEQQITNEQPNNPAIRRIHDALQALARNDRTTAKELINRAMITASR